LKETFGKEEPDENKKEAKEFGYEVGKISMKEKTVIFNKV